MRVNTCIAFFKGYRRVSLKYFCYQYNSNSPYLYGNNSVARICRIRIFLIMNPSQKYLKNL